MGTAVSITTTGRTWGFFLPGLLERALLLYPRASLFLGCPLLLLRTFSCLSSPCPRSWRNCRAPPDSLHSCPRLVYSLVAGCTRSYFLARLAWRRFDGYLMLARSPRLLVRNRSCWQRFGLHSRALARTSALLARLTLLPPWLTALARSVAVASPTLLSVPDSVAALP
jgi:hypothetical protein